MKYNLMRIERETIEAALRESEWPSLSEAAKLLGITRHALRRRMIKHNIRWVPPAEQRDTEDAGALKAS